MKKLYIVLLIITLFISGCSNNKIESDQSTISSISSENSQKIYQIIKNATYERAILSTEIYKFPNLANVYGETFNYKWDLDKINSLEDSDMKTFFINLSSSYYKISTHKNYLDVDIDYERLKDFENLSDELKTYIDININKRKILLASSAKGEFDYKSLRDNIILLENFLSDYPNTEILFEAESLYKNLISMYFIGSDGLDPFDYENKKFKDSFFSTLVDSSLNLPDTMFADISRSFLNQIDNTNTYKNIDYVSLISNYKKMGLANDNKIKSIVSENSDNSNIIYPQFESFKDSYIEKTINKKIVSEVESIKTSLKWDSDENTKYNISYFINYGSYKYISMQVTGSSYNRENNEGLTVQKNLNFDLSTGKTIKLSELFGQDFEAYREKLTNLIKSSDDIKSRASFDMLLEEPEFMIANLSIVLYFEKGQYGFDEKYPVYVYIKQSDISDLIDFRALYK